MKKVKWNTNSWHFKLAKLGGLKCTWVADPKTPEEIQRAKRGDTWGIEKKKVYNGNICEYIPCVISGFFKFLVAASVITVCLMPVAIFIAYLAACLSTWSIIEMDFLAKLGMVIIGVCISIVVGFFLVGITSYYYQIYTEKNREKLELKEQEKKYRKAQKQPGFLVTWYTKFKEKTCIGIEIE